MLALQHSTTPAGCQQPAETGSKKPRSQLRGFDLKADRVSTAGHPHTNPLTEVCQSFELTIHVDRFLYERPGEADRLKRLPQRVFHAI